MRLVGKGMSAGPGCTFIPTALGVGSRVCLGLGLGLRIGDLRFGALGLGLRISRSRTFKAVGVGLGLEPYTLNPKL